MRDGSLEIYFHDMADETDRLIYVILVTFCEDRLLLVRHRQRTTWEMPAGHIEQGETPDEAAARELVEETGALTFHIKALCDYSVVRDGNAPRYGRLYQCEVQVLGQLGDTEIAEVKLVDRMPENLTYGDIQPMLFAYVKNHGLI